MACLKISLFIVLVRFSYTNGVKQLDESAMNNAVKKLRAKTADVTSTLATANVSTLTALAAGADECGGSCRTAICPVPQTICGVSGVKRDSCGCCDTCRVGRQDVCNTITCPRLKICTPNIQGIPMCRCPSILSCPRKPVRPLKRLCGTNGITYRSRCAMRVSECSMKQKIRVAHRGICVHTPKDETLQEKLKEKLARKVQRRAKKEEKLRIKKLRKKRKRKQIVRTGITGAMARRQKRKRNS